MSETNTPITRLVRGHIECEGMILRTQLHELESDSPHEPINTFIEVRSDAVTIDIQGGERIWIERVNGVTMVRVYDQSHDEPISLSLGKDQIIIDSEDYDGRLAA